MTFSSSNDRTKDGFGFAALVRVLLALGVLAIFVAPTAWAAGDHKYVGVKKCKTCHKKEAIGNQYGKWLDAKHAKAFESLGTDDAKKFAAEKGIDDPQADGKCLKCHITGWDVSEELGRSKLLDADGVQCESCHGPGSDYRKKKVMIDAELAKSKGLIRPTEEDCLRCHNDESPAWDPEKYTLKDGSKAGFDFEQAKEKIAHPVPEDYDPEGEDEAD